MEANLGNLLQLFSSSRACWINTFIGQLLQSRNSPKPWDRKIHTSVSVSPLSSVWLEPRTRFSSTARPLFHFLGFFNMGGFTRQTPGFDMSVLSCSEYRGRHIIPKTYRSYDFFSVTAFETDCLFLVKSYWVALLKPQGDKIQVVATSTVYVMSVCDRSVDEASLEHT